MMADAGAMRQFARYAKSSGLSLNAALDDQLRAIVGSSETEDRIPSHAIVDVLELCSIVARRPTLGAELALWSDMHGYGVLSLLWDHFPTVAEALRINTRYLHLESEAVGMRIEQSDDEVVVRNLLMIPARYGGTQFLQGTLMLLVRVIRPIMGEGWAPVRLELEQRAPSDARYLKEHFRCPIEFGAERSAIIIRREDLYRPSPRGNAHVLSYLERQLTSLEQTREASIVNQVSLAIESGLSSGRSGLEHVAASIGLTPRTLQRRLEAENLEYSALLNRVRRRVAEQYMVTEHMPPLAQLAFRLGYSEASTASRFLRQQFGASLRELALRASPKTPSTRG